MSKRDRIENAVGMIGDDLIDEYLERTLQNRRSIPLRKIVVIAAAALLIVSAALGIGIFMGKGRDIETENHSKAPMTHESVSGKETETDPVKPEKLPFGIVSIEAKDSDGKYITTDAEFVIKTENGSVRSLSEAVVLTPAYEYTVTELEKDSFVLKVTENIPDNSTLKIDFVKDSVVIRSWQFATREVLSITETFPADGSMACDVNTTYELVLSYAGCENVPEHVTFEPHIDGEWSHIGKTWRFIPYGPLTADTTYTVSVAPGITNGESVIETEFASTFGTYPADITDTMIITPQYLTVDKVNTYRQKDAIYMMFSAKVDGSHGSLDVPYDTLSNAIDSVTVECFATHKDFLADLGGARVESETLTIDTHLNHFTTGGSFVYILGLDETLSTGYYKAVVRTAKGRHLFDWHFQVNDTSAYMIQTGYEILLLVSEDGELAKDVKVQFDGKEYFTDENGSVAIDLKKRDVSGEYITVGDVTPVLICADNVGVTYHKGYIYTDLQVYRPGDTLNVWGVIPNLNVPEISDGKAEIVVYKNYNRELFRCPVTLDENGTFEYSYKLEKFESGTHYRVCLTLDTVTVASRYFTVAKFEESVWEYELDIPKNHMKLGESFNFSVKVSHISGLPAVNKKVNLSVLYSDYVAVTDESGIARISIDTSTAYQKALSVTKTADVPLLSFVVSLNGDYGIPFCRSDTNYLQIKPLIMNSENNKGKYHVTVNEIVLPENDKVNSKSELYGDGVERVVTVSVIEKVRERYVSYYRYDELIKENVPVYNYSTSTNQVYDFTAVSVNGEFVFDVNLMVDVKKSTHTKYYYYQVEFEFTDDGISYTTGSDYYPGGGLAYSFERFDGSFSQYDISYSYGQGTGDAYTSYEYKLEVLYDNEADRMFKVGDKVNFNFEGYNGSSTVGGKLLRIVFGNGVMSCEDITGSDLSMTFEANMLPGVFVTGVYYKDGVFHRMPVYELRMDPAERKLNVDVVLDKEYYAPGETVSMKLKVTDENGKAVEGVSLNLSVVNAALGDLPEINSLRYIKSMNYYDVYTFSTYRPYYAFTYIPAYGGGGGVEFRVDFNDVPYFGGGISDENGELTVKFKLPDNVTRYNYTVHGVNGELYEGTFRDSFEVKMDFFIQQSEIYDVKCDDDFVVNVVGVGEDGTVNAEVTLKELGKKVSISGRIGEALNVNFGKLPAGTYTVSIVAESGGKKDALEYPVTIAESYQTVKRNEQINGEGTVSLKPEKYPVNIKLTTKTYSRYAKYLGYLVPNNRSRTDMILAYDSSISVRQEIHESKYYHAGSVYVTTDGLIKPLSTAEGDVVLTAIAIGFGDYNPGTTLETKLESYVKSTRPETLTEAIELMLLECAMGCDNAENLKYLYENLDDDDYLEIIISLGLILNGEYDFAKEAYLDSENDSGNEGYQALKALASVYVEPERASELIDAYIADDKSDYLLGFAVSAFMNERIGISENTETVKIKIGYNTEKIELSALEVRFISVTEPVDEIVFDNMSDGIEISYEVAERLEELEKISGNIDAYFGEVYTDENGFEYFDICFDLSSVDNETGTLRLTLPDSLRLDSDIELPYGYYVSDRNVNEIVINKWKSRDEWNKVTDYNGNMPYTDQVCIKTTVRYPGNFKLESAVFTTHENEYYVSNGVFFDLK